jgi:hypothetical protein
MVGRLVETRAEASLTIVVIGVIIEIISEYNFRNEETEEDEEDQSFHNCLVIRL